MFSTILSALGRLLTAMGAGVSRGHDPVAERMREAIAHLEASLAALRCELG